MPEFLLISAVVGVMVAIKMRAEIWKWLTERLRPQEDPPVPPIPEILPSTPEPALVIPPPNYGNIRPVLDEETDPVEFGPEIHEFPQQDPPVTRFEDFNRRLFVYGYLKDRHGKWPETTDDDFPTRLTIASYDRLIEGVRIHLRPRYPVIIDTYGWWAASSRALEMYPDQSNDIIEAYLAIPEHQRPVIMSAELPAEAGNLICVRYGYSNFAITAQRLAPYVQPMLTHLIAKLIGEREKWMWFSVARMRHEVIGGIKVQEAMERALQDMNYIEGEISKSKAGRNKFASLWKSRVSFTDMEKEEHIPDAAPTAAAQEPHEKGENA